MRTIQKIEKEYVLSRQLLKSGTAVGAMVREAEFAQSMADFINKMSQGLEEANETGYWIDLLKDTNYISKEKHTSLLTGCKELIAMLAATVKTSKERGRNTK